MSRKVIELGNYIVPAYAGMLLAEQGLCVEKWTNGRDPILGLKRGDELWSWINHKKAVVQRDAADICACRAPCGSIIIDNFLPKTLTKMGVDPVELAESREWVWVSMRSEVGGRSFDVLAQARAWMDFAPYVPFYIGDTAPGLFLAFKALAAGPGHHVLGQSSCLAKLVEGELVVDVDRPGGAVPWDVDSYGIDAAGNAVVAYKGEEVTESPKDRGWKMRHLWHDGTGRMRI